MRFLIFSDLHNFNINYLKNIKEDFDIIITLGDMKTSILELIRDEFPNKDIYSLLGNHDDIGMIEKYNNTLNMKNKKSIINLNLNNISYDNISFTGIEGSHKYKENQPGYSQIESLKLKTPKADILFSHDTGYKYVKNKKKYKDTHIGLIGIKKYINKNKPKYHIFGHYHEDIMFKKNDTICYCVYGCSIFDYDNGIMKKIF